jgi:hypothetical protein
LRLACAAFKTPEPYPFGTVSFVEARLESMSVIARYSRILIACLIAVVLSVGTTRADSHLMRAENPIMVDCMRHHLSPNDRHPAKQVPFGSQAHCCSIGHCWVATAIDAPAFAAAPAGLRVADLTGVMTVGATAARLERPPQLI